MSIFDVLILIVAIAAIGVVYYFGAHKDGDVKPNRSGDLSAQNAAAKPLAAAKRLALMQQYQVISPAHLAHNGKFADLDFVLVGCFGLLCVKCIGLGGELYGTADDKEWLQIRKGERIPFANPLEIAAADTRLVRDALFTAKLKSTPVETAVVFANPKAQLSLPRKTGHYTLKTFRALLSKDKFLQNKGVDIEKAAAAVRAYLAPEP